MQTFCTPPYRNVTIIWRPKQLPGLKVGHSTIKIGKTYLLPNRKILPKPPVQMNLRFSSLLRGNADMSYLRNPLWSYGNDLVCRLRKTIVF